MRRSTPSRSTVSDLTFPLNCAGSVGGTVIYRVYLPGSATDPTGGGGLPDMRVQMEARMQRVDSIAHRLVHPGARLSTNRQALAHLETRLCAALGRRLRREAVNLQGAQARLRQARPAC